MESNSCRALLNAIGEAGSGFMGPAEGPQGSRCGGWAHWPRPSGRKWARGGPPPGPSPPTGHPPYTMQGPYCLVGKFFATHPLAWCIRATPLAPRASNVFRPWERTPGYREGGSRAAAWRPWTASRTPRRPRPRRSPGRWAAAGGLLYSRTSSAVSPLPSSLLEETHTDQSLRDENSKDTAPLLPSHVRGRCKSGGPMWMRGWRPFWVSVE